MKTVKIYGPGRQRRETTEAMVREAAVKRVHAGGLPDAGTLEVWLDA